jgi:hypothetical protein
MRIGSTEKTSAQAWRNAGTHRFNRFELLTERAWN